MPFLACCDWCLLERRRLITCRESLKTFHVPHLHRTVEKLQCKYLHDCGNASDICLHCLRSKKNCTSIQFYLHKSEDAHEDDDEIRRYFMKSYSVLNFFIY